MKITDEWLMQNRTRAGAWTRAQLEVIGIKWPPRHGWKHQVIGKDLSDAEVARFISAANIRAKRTQKNDEKQATIDQELDRLIAEQNRDRIDFRRWAR